MNNEKKNVQIHELIAAMINLIVFILLMYYFIYTTWPLPNGNTEAFELLVVFLLLKDRRGSKNE